MLSKVKHVLLIAIILMKVLMFKLQEIIHFIITLLTKFLSERTDKVSFWCFSVL